MIDKDSKAYEILQVSAEKAKLNKEKRCKLDNASQIKSKEILKTH